MIRLSSGGANPTQYWEMLRRASQARTERLLLDAESAARLRHKLALMDHSSAHRWASLTFQSQSASQNGGTLAQRILTVHVDDKLCNNCEAVLPYVGLELGNPTVTFVDPTGTTRTMRDGAWLD
jgi:hypothetical protein